jgi:hypothetical protein
MNEIPSREITFVWLNVKMAPTRAGLPPPTRVESNDSKTSGSLSELENVLKEAGSSKWPQK